MPAAYRLPPDVRPESYEVKLDADVARPTFSGEVVIALRLAAARGKVDVHGRDLEIAQAEFEVAGKPVAARIEADPARERFIIHAEAPLPAGPVNLRLHYTGKVSANMEGLYLSKDGDEVCLASQCEETDARAIVPCFDEPAMKATWRWNVTTSAEHTVLSNAPVDKVEERADGKKTWHFKTTPKISSYLIAVAVGPFVAAPAVDVAGVPLRVWAMPGKEALGAFGRDFAADLLAWYNDYFGVDYPFHKYDQIAVPSFSAGAMENPGLVLFRKDLLLHDADTTSLRQEKLIARVIAHEFAHMWFGNLVTMAWWDDLWLNESFAEWMAHKAVHALRPEYSIWDDFQAGAAQALVADALDSTHPIYSPVETPEQATELFDSITYDKGSAVMRMLENHLGESAFRDGLRSYMQAFSYGNATGGDLWSHLAAASGQPVLEIMTSWVGQGGYPIIDARLEGTTLELSQQRYHSTPDTKDSQTLWHVPLVLRYQDDDGVHETRALMSQRDMSLKVKASGAIRWLTTNADAIGFYRQHFDDHARAGLLTHVTSLSSFEQTRLLDDAWALLRAGVGSAEAYLQTLDALARRPASYAVLETVVGHIERLDDLLGIMPHAAAAPAGLRHWIRDVFEEQWDTIGAAPRPGESSDTALRRGALIHALAAYGHEGTVQALARELAAREKVYASAVNANLAGLAVGLAARFGDAKVMRDFVAVYESRRAAGAPPAHASRYLNALPWLRNEEAILGVLDILKTDRFPLEAHGPLLRALLSSRYAGPHTWAYLKENWSHVRAHLGDMWTGFLVEHTGHLPVELEGDITKFFDENLGDVAQQAYGRAKERLAQRAEFEPRARAAIASWFAKR